MDLIAAHCEGWSCSCSNTMRTARLRTSGEYLFDLLMTPSSQSLESPEKPGRFTNLFFNEQQDIGEVKHREQLRREGTKTRGIVLCFIGTSVPVALGDHAEANIFS